MAGRCGCSRPCNCCTSSSASVAVVGSGSAGGCFTPSVLYSTDPGNIAQAGSDGAVLATVDLVAPSGDHIDPAPDGSVQLPAPCIRTYGGGDVLEVGEDGCVSLPTAGPPSDFACGLAVDDDGNLVVNTSGTWPTTGLDGEPAAGLITDGSVIYCDPVTGQVYGAPEHTSRGVATQDTLLAETLIAVPATYTTAASAPLMLTNVSPSRSMTVLVFERVQVDLVAQPTSGPLVRMQHRIDGGTWTETRQGRWPSATSGADIRASSPLIAMGIFVVGPADSLTVELRAVVSATGSSDLSLIAASSGLTMLGVTR